MYIAYMGDHYQIIPVFWGLQSSEEDGKSNNETDKS